MGKLLSLIITLLFLAFGVVVGVLNPELVKLNLFTLYISLPLGLSLMLFFVLGILIGALTIFPQVMRLRWQLKLQRKANTKQVNEIIDLKKKLNGQTTDKVIQQQAALPVSTHTNLD